MQDVFESLQVDPELNIPIYRQVVQGIANAIRMGRLEAEKKLPTVQEWADRLGIARGTMKRVYALGSAVCENYKTKSPRISTIGNYRDTI